MERALIKTGHLWAIGYEDMQRTEQVRAEIAAVDISQPQGIDQLHLLEGCVQEAMRLGVHEFLVKPVSGEALHGRLASVLLNPRPMARRGEDNRPVPRP